MPATSKFKLLTAAAVLGAISVPVVAHAQQQPPPGGGGDNGGGGGGNRGGGRGNFNPQQWRQQMLDRLKDQLGSSEDEFAAIEPKIEKVFQMQMAANAGRGMGGRGGGNRRGGGGGGGGGGMPGGDSAVAKASTDLRTTLEDKDAKPEDVKTKLEALRTARTAAKAELAKAQDDLKGVLTARQEAVLVEAGMLD